MRFGVDSSPGLLLVLVASSRTIPLASPAPSADVRSMRKENKPAEGLVCGLRLRGVFFVRDGDIGMHIRLLLFYRIDFKKEVGARGAGFEDPNLPGWRRPRPHETTGKIIENIEMQKKKQVMVCGVV